MSLRVIGGVLRGRVLSVPPGRSIRPTSNRVREALFSSIQEQLPGARVLDLYAGSGALGIEALSRGAESVVFVERAAAALDALQRNLDALGLVERSAVMRCEVLVALRRLRSDPKIRFDLILADPPYGAEDLPEALASLVEGGLLAPAGMVVVEASRRHPVGVVAGLECERERTYGDTVLSRWRPSAAPRLRGPAAEEPTR
jgi:16S rRNA (guanine966-N2)-methyltransferase